MPVPSNEEAVVEKAVDSKPQESDSVREVPKQPKSGAIEVVAIAHGFYKNMRKVPGEVFMVPSMEKLGAWMKCTDKELEKKHQEAIRAKKAGK